MFDMGLARWVAKPWALFLDIAYIGTTVVYR